jgi:hypothetical protein
MVIATKPSTMWSETKYIPYFILAVVAAVSAWFYVDQILVAYQMADAAAHDRPRGNLSDLYPRWLGARELLLHGRNPYGDDIAIEIQKGYYGRALNPARPNDPKDQQGFAYPVYVVFLLAPLIAVPFHQVQLFFYWFLVAMTAVSVALWFRLLRWSLPPILTATAVVLTLGSLPAVQGLKLQQLSLLVAAILAAAAACVAHRHLLCGAVLLAIATIKPQLALPLIAWLSLWAFSHWSARRRFVYGFAGTMALLVGAGEFVLPGWLGMFREAIEKYHRYTQNASVLDELFPWAHAGKVLAVAAALASVWLMWRFRHEPAESKKFGIVTALVMALTVLIVPMYAPYNQVLLLPTAFVLIRDRNFFLTRSGGLRFLYVAAVFALVWQWIASVGLSVVYLLVSPAWALRAWKWPFLATFTVPVLIFALVVVEAGGLRELKGESS